MSKKQIEYNEIKEQLDLFYTTSSLSPNDREKYSSTIELYDSIPKLSFEKLPDVKGPRTLDTISKTFKHRNKMYDVKLIPGFLPCGGGKRKEFYLTKREEIVENMLIKFAVDGCASLVDDELTIFFTLYQLEKELKKHGHGYSRKEIRDAIDILGTAQFILSTLDDSESYKGNFITDVGTSTRNVEGEGNRKMYVKFNSLVSRAIKRKATRIINFDLLMKHKSLLARLLIKRISHLFTQADISNPYKIKASTIIRDTGLVEYKRHRDTLRKIQEAWDELEKHGMVSRYEQKKVYDEDNKRKIKDIVYTVFLSQKFVNDIIIANKVVNDDKVESLPHRPASEAIEKLQMEFNLSAAEAKAIVENYQLQRILNNADYVKSYKNKIENKKAFLKAAISENYAGSGEAIYKLEDQKEEKKEIKTIVHKNNCYSKKEEKNFMEFLENIKEIVGKDEYNNWFSGLSLLNSDDNEYELGVQSKFYKHWLESVYPESIKNAYSKVYEDKRNVVIKIMEKKS